MQRQSLRTAGLQSQFQDSQGTTLFKNFLCRPELFDKALQHPYRTLSVPYAAQLCPGHLIPFCICAPPGSCSFLQLLAAIQLFGANLDDYLHLLLPPIVKLFDAPEVPLPSRK
jgi:hypothetical protein